MKKKNLKSLKLNKKSISNLHKEEVNGGNQVTMLGGPCQEFTVWLSCYHCPSALCETVLCDTWITCQPPIG